MDRLTVAVVGICGAGHLRRCLEALEAQVEAPPFDVVVVFDPHLRDIAQLQSSFPNVRMVSNEGQRTPLELASRAIRESAGDLVLLTEDHCVPRPDWVRRLFDAHRVDRAAVGGAVEVGDEVSSVDWAFYFVDFFRYATPKARGPAGTLTVCNVAYRRSCLEQIRGVWEAMFHETAVNDTLRARFGPLWMEPDARVRMRRHVRFGDALRERYAFGRLFGCTRLQFVGTGRRWYYTCFAPALPVLLFGRMARVALPDLCLRRPFVRSIPCLVAMVLAWSWGEWLGYLTRRRPGALTTASEIDG